MADQNHDNDVFGVILHDQGFNLPGQVVKQLVNVGLETLSEQRFRDEFNRLKILPDHDNIAPYTGHQFIDEPNDELVRLVFCQHQGTRLDELLPGNFDWATHYNIIQGITSGLCFLQEARPGDHIYHLDMRPCNIFLDNAMQPKIAFFGQPRLFARDQNLNVPGNVARPYGYVAPEYQSDGVITDRSDVFGLGILMLEILIRQQFNPEEISIQDYVAVVRENWSNVELIRIRYPELDDDGLMQVMGCIAVAIECLEIDPNIRPSARQINGMLNAGRPFDNNLMKYCINHFSNPPGNIGYMLSARALRLEHSNEWTWLPTPGGGGITRFPERAELEETLPLHISGKIATKHLMLHMKYSVHLVYALAPNYAGLEGEHRSEIQSVPVDQQQNFQGGEERSVRLVGPPPPAAGAEPDVTYPIYRGDGTMEIELGSFQMITPVEHVHGPDDAVIAQLSVISGSGVTVTGLIVEGMEFRPLNFV